MRNIFLFFLLPLGCWQQPLPAPVALPTLPDHQTVKLAPPQVPWPTVPNNDITVLTRQRNPIPFAEFGTKVIVTSVGLYQQINGTLFPLPGTCCFCVDGKPLTATSTVQRFGKATDAQK